MPNHIIPIHEDDAVSALTIHWRSTVMSIGVKVVESDDFNAKIGLEIDEKIRTDLEFLCCNHFEVFHKVE